MASSLGGGRGREKREGRGVDGDSLQEFGLVITATMATRR
jgi:hypothetical protein